MKKRTLVTWIGNTDLWALYATLKLKREKAVIEKVFAEQGIPMREVDGSGPVQGLLAGEEFTEIHILSNYSAAATKLYTTWLNRKVKTHPASLTNVTDHSQILETVTPILDKLKLSDGHELCFHTSPGTPQMASIWILLAKSKYPATLFKTYKKQINEVDLPFDVTVELVPKLFENPDRFWQHLVDDGPEETPGFRDIKGKSTAIKEAIGRAKRASLFDVNVLLLGEAGTGKEMFAKAIHAASPRRDKPFIAINCAAISKELIESELFGHKAGAFSGADKDHDGAFMQADGGTLFLDEVGECDLSLQAKLLRALQPPHNASLCKREFRPVGGTKDQSAEVRVVAATNRNLTDFINAGNFRKDLFYRLSTISVKLPSLRARRGDISVLAKSLLAQINEQLSSHERPGYVEKTLAAETVKFLEGYSWPGNVRELYNALVQAAIMQDAPKLKPRDIESALSSIPSLEAGPTDEIVFTEDFHIDQYLGDAERRAIQQALLQAKDNMTAAARVLGLDRGYSLQKRMEKPRVGLLTSKKSK